MHILLSLSTFALALTLAAAPAIADPAPETRQQRADFLAAESALKRGNLTEFEHLLRSLHHYPLYPYLRFEQLNRTLSQARDSDIAAFITDNAGTPLADRLRQRWLQSLAQRGQWQQLLANYPAHGVGTELECHRRLALHHTGRTGAALENITSLWLVAQSQPAACDRLFSLWQQQGGVTTELAWQRFRLAMAAQQTRLARYLLRFMSGQEKEWAELWLQVHNRPHLLNTGQLQAISPPVRDDILAHGIQRMASTDLEQAISLWDRSREEGTQIGSATRVEIEGKLATMLALRSHPLAVQRLTAVDDEWSDDTVRAWRVRASLAREDWYGVLRAIDRLNETERAAPDWRYWRARALAALGQEAHAEEIYLELAIERGYYAFLAADQLDLPYAFQHAPLSAEATDPVTSEAAAGMVRARELHALDRLLDARREWHYATRNLNNSQLQTAATLAHNWGWHDRAILTLARSSARDDIEMRFPLAHREQIVAQARAHNIDAALAYAVVRQESAFAPDARSPAGALGLMQLMPATARRVAAHLNMPPPDQSALSDIGTNLRLGLTYLRQMLDRFGHQAAAVAAYNAGPQRVENWLPKDHLMAADIWAETIPFRETRNYVQNVLYFSTIYEHRMELPASRLAQRMPVVISQDARLTRSTEPAAPGPVRTIVTPSS